MSRFFNRKRSAMFLANKWSLFSFSVVFILSIFSCFDEANVFAAVAPDSNRTFTHPSENNQTKNLTVTTGTYTFRTDADPNAHHVVDWYATYSGTSNVLESEHFYYYADHNFTFASSGNYWVRAEVYKSGITGSKGSWEAAYRWYVTVTNPNRAPSMPGTISKSGSTRTSITVKWGAATDSDGSISRYYVERKRNSLSWDNWEVCNNTTSLSLTCTGLVAGEDYYFQVRAKDNDGAYGSWRESSAFWTNPPNNSPGQPGVISKKSSTRTSITVKWGAATDSDGSISRYYVERKRNSLSWDNWEVCNNTTSLSLTCTGLVAGEDYYFQVRAKDNDGAYGSWRESSTFWTNPPNSAPPTPGTLSSSNVTTTSARVSWGASIDTDGDSITYTVEYKKDASTWIWETIGSFTTSSTYKDISGLNADTVYDVRVRAFDGELYSSPEWNDQEKVITTLPVNFTGDLTVTVNNISGGNTEVPKDRATVELYNSENNLLKSATTNTSGVTTLTDIPVGSNYYYKVFVDSPSGFGTEYWGQKTGITINAGSNTDSFTRYMPWGEAVQFHKGNENITGGDVLINTPLTPKVWITNGDNVSNTISVELVIDSGQSPTSPYPYDQTVTQVVSGFTSGTLFTFPDFMPPQVGTYNYSIRVKSDTSATDLWQWGDAVTAKKPTPGVTVLVHGFRKTGDGGWWFNGANPVEHYWDDNREFISSLLRAFGGGIVLIYEPASGAFVENEDLSNKYRNEGLYNANGHTILVHDWLKVSNDAESGHAEAAAEALFTALIDPDGDGILENTYIDLNDPNKNYKLHLIGHSRGTSVVSETVQRLGVYGIKVNYVTYLDPHDFDENDGSIYGGVWGVPFDEKFHDPATQIWSNVKYADNYFQFAANDIVPSGRSLKHLKGFFNYTFGEENNREELGNYLYNYNLTPLDGFGNNAANGTISQHAHGKVIDWYLGTISPNSAELSAEWYKDGDGFGFDTGFSKWLQLGGFDYDGTTNGIIDPANPFNPVTSEGLKPYPTENDGDADQAPTSFFNGDFDLPDLGATLLDNGSLAGWTYHGGGGNGHINAGHLVLDRDNTSRKHNRFYIPENATVIKYKLWVRNIDGGTLPDVDKFEVLFNGSPLDDQTKYLDTRDYRYVDKTIMLSPQQRDTVATLTFKIHKNGTWFLNSEVWIDDVRLVIGPSVSISLPSSNIEISNDQNTIEFTGTASAGTEIISQVQYRIDGGNWNLANGTTSWSFTAANLTVGENLIEVRVQDNNSIYGESVSRTITRLAPPENVIPVVSITSPTTDKTISYEQANYAFAGNATDNDGSVDLVEYRVNSNAWKTASGTDSWNFTANGLYIGNNLVEVRAKDNSSAYSVIRSRLIIRNVDQPRDADITPPTGSISINNGVAYTNSISVTLSMSASDLSGVSEMCISNTTSCSSWESYATSKSWTLSSGEGIKTVYVWFKDGAGNANSSPYSDSIILSSLALQDEDGNVIPGGQTVEVDSGESLNLTPTGGSGDYSLEVTSSHTGAGEYNITYSEEDGAFTFEAPETGAFAGDYTLTLTDDTNGWTKDINIYVPLKIKVSKVNILEETGTETVTVTGGSPGDSFTFTVLDGSGEEDNEGAIATVAAAIAADDPENSNPVVSTIETADVDVLTPFTIQAINNTQLDLSPASTGVLRIIPTVTYSGIIVDEEGNGVNGVTIETLNLRDENGNPYFTTSAQIDGVDGVFNIAVPIRGEGHYIFLIHKDGYVMSRIDGEDYIQDGTTPNETTITISSSGGSISGNIVGLEDNDRAEVYAYYRDESDQVQLIGPDTVTGGAGPETFSIEVDSLISCGYNISKVVVIAEGYLSASNNGNSGNGFNLCSQSDLTAGAIVLMKADVYEVNVTVGTVLTFSETANNTDISSYSLEAHDANNWSNQIVPSSVLPSGSNLVATFDTDQDMIVILLDENSKVAFIYTYHSLGGIIATDRPTGSTEVNVYDGAEVVFSDKTDPDAVIDEVRIVIPADGIETANISGGVQSATLEVNTLKITNQTALAAATASQVIEVKLNIVDNLGDLLIDHVKLDDFVIKRIQITIPFDTTMIAPGEIESGDFVIYHASTLEGFERANGIDIEGGDVFTIPTFNIIEVDYLNGTVTFEVSHLSVFGIGKALNGGGDEDGNGSGGGGDSGSGDSSTASVSDSGDTTGNNPDSSESGENTGGGGGGGGCFIATAAFGSYEAPYVMLLRDFRDEHLLTNDIGKKFVKVYYTYSPPIADFISESDYLKAIVRVGLLPLIGFAGITVGTTIFQKLSVLLLIWWFVSVRTSRKFYLNQYTSSQTGGL